MLNWIKSLKKKVTSSKRSKDVSTSEKKLTKAKSEKNQHKKIKSTASLTAQGLTQHKVEILSRGQHGISRNNIDDHALKVLYRLHKAGFHACLVGGAVRDLLIGVKPKDFDVATDATPEQVARCVETIGVGFMFAPMHHSAMKHAIGPRKEMAVRTIFNILGPLTNPAGADSQVMGVYSKQWVRPVAEVLQRLGSRHVMVVHAADGLDEISIGAETFVAEAKDGEIIEYTITPEQFGLPRAELSSIAADGVEASLAMLRGVLANEDNPAADIVALNAGAAIYVAGLADTLEQGVTMAQDAIGSGIAKDKLAELVNMSAVYQQEAEA